MFVCMGNICRSPLAHTVFEYYVKNKGLTDYTVDSTGVIGFHAGETADSRMRATAAKHGIQITHRAKKITMSDLKSFDLILVMDRSNMSEIRNITDDPSLLEKVEYFREYDPENNGNIEVPDPYYGGDSGFENVFDIADRTCRNLLSVLDKNGVK